MKITWLFAVGLFLSGCGKKGSEAKGDCGTSVENAVKVSSEELKKNNFSDDAIAKIKDASLVRCKEDKWSNEVLKCLAAAKKADDIKNCNNMMSKEQRDNMDKALAAMATQDMGSGSDQGSAGSGVGSGSAEATGSGSDSISGLPTECAQYKSMMEKLATCAAYPQAARDTLKKTYDAASQAWANFDKLPAASKATLETSCKQGVEALKKAAGATCGF